jgi:hypothetical protein
MQVGEQGRCIDDSWRSRMISVIWAPMEKPSERHIVLHIHRQGMPVIDKGYFFLSDQKDWGGAGPFDMRLDEALKRAENRASELGLEKIYILRSP